MTIEDWVRSHRFLDPLARVRRRIDDAVAEAVITVAPPSAWDEYVEDYAAGVPLLHSQMPIDLPAAEPAIIAVLRRLAFEAVDDGLVRDAAALIAQFDEERLAPGRIVEWLSGDESWEPVTPGVLRSVGWITLSAALRPVVAAFGQWRDQDKWLRRYCPTCGALPAMAHMVGVDPGRRRLLCCGRCASEWRYGRTECPFCETDPQHLATLGIEGEGGLRIDYCEACHAYLKSYSGQGDEQVLLADWTSLHLDHMARERGWVRMAGSLYELAPAGPVAPPAFGADSGQSESGANESAAVVH